MTALDCAGCAAVAFFLGCAAEALHLPLTPSAMWTASAVLLVAGGVGAVVADWRQAGSS